MFVEQPLALPGSANDISPFVDASGKQISVLLFASVERFGVSCMRDFCGLIGIVKSGDRQLLSLLIDQSWQEKFFSSSESVFH